MGIKSGTETKQILEAPDCLRVPATRKIPDISQDIREGLLEPPRTLPPKYFYDDHGSLLFDKICETEEYYPTRTEDALLSRYGADIIAATTPHQILELGSGSSRKTRRLLDACEEHPHTCEYAPFDVCEEIVHVAANELMSDYRWLDVVPMVGDYHAGLGELPAIDGIRMVVFLGSTIGNFTETKAQQFIDDIRACMQPGDYFLIGADRTKDNRILHAAYNDAQGLTAEFNLNVLRVLNRQAGAKFDLNNFAHHAVYNEKLNQIEMYLISRIDQDIHLGDIDETISLKSGEKIMTEISRKFEPAQVEAMLEMNGFEIIRHYEPDNQYFSLVLARLI